MLRPEFVGGRFFFYGHPQGSIYDSGQGCGVGCSCLSQVSILVAADEEKWEQTTFYGIKGLKNGLGPLAVHAPEGRPHIACGIRCIALGLRYAFPRLSCAA